jgi:hypothetical protein
MVHISKDALERARSNTERNQDNCGTLVGPKNIMEWAHGSYALGPWTSKLHDMTYYYCNANE